MEKKFETLEANSCDFTLKNAWFDHCRRTAIPCITIRPKRKFATVDCHCITLPEELDELLDSMDSELIAGFRALRLTYGYKRTQRGGGGKSSYFQNIAIDQAEELAEELFDFVSGTLGLDFPKVEAAGLKI